MNSDKQKIIVVVVAIVLIIAIGSRANFINQESVQDRFRRSGVVTFISPFLDETITEIETPIYIVVDPTNMTGLFVLEYYLYLVYNGSSALISENTYYSDTAKFTIHKVISFGPSGEYEALLLLKVYYNEEYHDFYTSRFFSYDRTNARQIANE